MVSRQIHQALRELDLQVMASQLSLIKFLARKFGPLSGPADSPALRGRAGNWLEFLKEFEGGFLQVDGKTVLPKMAQQLAARKLIEQIEETLK